MSPSTCSKRPEPEASREVSGVREKDAGAGLPRPWPWGGFCGVYPGFGLVHRETRNENPHLCCSLYLWWTSVRGFGCPEGWERQAKRPSACNPDPLLMRGRKAGAQLTIQPNPSPCSISECCCPKGISVPIQWPINSGLKIVDKTMKILKQADIRTHLWLGLSLTLQLPRLAFSSSEAFSWSPWPGLRHIRPLHVSF